MNRLTELPLIKALLKVLSNDSLIYAVVGIVSAMYLDTREYDVMITGAVLAFAGFIIGASEWRDVQTLLLPFAGEIEQGLTDVLHNKLTITLPNGQALELDFPDSMEAETVALLVKHLTGNEKEDVA